MAVYTEVTDEELERFVGRYDVGKLLSYKGIAEGVENTNYLVHTGRGAFILTVYEKRVRRSDLPFFLGLMEHLAAKGIPCPTPVRDRRGSHQNEIAGHAAALITFLDGYWVRRPRAEHCLAVGKALAEFHEAGTGFALSRANALGPAGWRPLFERFRGECDAIRKGLGDTIEDELAILESHWPRGLPEGVIHADVFPDNVFFLGGRLSGLIDFYFACNDALAYDLAVALNAWCFETDAAFNVTKGRALLRGYETVRKLTAAEAAALPTLARGAALRFLLTRAHDWLNTAASALVRPHDPIEFVRRLRFHAGAGSIRDYGYETP